MKQQTPICVGAALAVLLFATPSQAASCTPVNGLSFVCGIQKSEDLVQIPGTRWLIGSGLTDGGGINLVDTEAKVASRFYTGAPAQLRPDKKLFPNCPNPPDVKTFNVHGLALHDGQSPGLYNLYAVSHGALESIQVFAVDARGAAPALTWTGCAPLPAPANAVAGLSDGSILATILLRPGTTAADFISGRKTGAVYEWKPGGADFRLLPGTELEGNNGIEISRDEKEFYVAVSGTQTVAVYSRARTAKPLRQVRTPWFNLDNVHWSGDRLIAAGMMYDEPACGGTRKQILDAHGDLNCHRGWVAAQLDPKAMTWKILAYGEPNPVFGGIATAAVIGDTLWLSSFQADRVAYRTLPGQH